MEVITSKWLADHLGDDRGKRAALAEALGVTPDKVSKMLAGTRKPQAEEIPTILAFFGEADPSADPELAAIWRELEPSERVFLLNAAKAQIAARRQSPVRSGEDSE